MKGGIIDFQLRGHNRRLSNMFFEDACSKKAELFFAVGVEVKTKGLSLYYNHLGGVDRIINIMEKFIEGTDQKAPVISSAPQEVQPQTNVLDGNVIAQLKEYNRRTADMFFNDSGDRNAELLFACMVGVDTWEITVSYDIIGSVDRVTEAMRHLSQALKDAEAQRVKKFGKE